MGAKLDLIATSLPIRGFWRLLHRDELRKLIRQVEEKGNTIIPLQLYFKGPYLKAEIAVARGKKEYDKRQQKEEKRMDRELRRVIKDHTKSHR